MRTLNYLLLPVRDPAASTRLYTRMLGLEPVHTSPAFVLYLLPNGVKLGLWAREDIQPPAGPPGGLEISFTEPDHEAVLETLGAWTKLGLEVLQSPTETPFGFTFVVADPDGHRLRVFAPPAQPR